jgi:hypothetical protein
MESSEASKKKFGDLSRALKFVMTLGSSEDVRDFKEHWFSIS